MATATATATATSIDVALNVANLVGTLNSRQLEERARIFGELCELRIRIVETSQNVLVCADAVRTIQETMFHSTDKTELEKLAEEYRINSIKLEELTTQLRVANTVRSSVELRYMREYADFDMDLANILL